MNIFFLDENPIKSARYLCNKHVCKLVVESAQLLCTCHHITGSLIDNTYPDLPLKFYKLTHKNHPCSKWLRENKDNYEWLSLHALALCEEYTYRYNKVHASMPLISWLVNNVPRIRLWRYQNYVNGLLEENDCPVADYMLGIYYVTRPPQCMPDQYKKDDVIQAYRNYYKLDKQTTIDFRYTKREKPSWL